MHVSNRLSRIAAEGVQKRKDELIERCVEMCERLENIRQDRDIEEIPEAKIDQRSNISQHLLLEALSIHENGEQLEQEKHLLETPPRRVSFQASGLEHGERMPRRGEGIDGRYFYRNSTDCRNKGFDESGLKINKERTIKDIVPVGTMSSNILNFPGEVEVVGKVLRKTQQPGTSTRSSKWNLNFDGQNMSITNFVERVEELRTACNIPKGQLIRFAPILLKGTPLHWFRNTTETLYNWDDVTYHLRLLYLSTYYDDDIWNDIRSRTQGQLEDTATYIINMESLFGKLRNKPMESERVKLVRERMLPFIQARLPLGPIYSLSELLRLGKWIEDVQIHTQRMKPPPTNRNLVTESEFMYNPRRHRLDAVATEQDCGHHGRHRRDAVATELDWDQHEEFMGETDPQIELAALQQRYRPSQNNKCFNCGKMGHMVRDCQLPKAIRCYRCGTPDRTIRTCEKCSKDSGNEHLGRDQTAS
ncbi:hypothetical protein JTB14_026969 [Gonioctena quinquepunctata]|nr:hypothetical protein JTB14_026969 [Gonioctena quinquepunctata]